jgi:hypothetical protein
MYWNGWTAARGETNRGRSVTLRRIYRRFVTDPSGRQPRFRFTLVPPMTE